MPVPLFENAKVTFIFDFSLYVLTRLIHQPLGWMREVKTNKLI